MTESEPEIVEALNCARAGQYFLMKGGAGSGKTYSMLRFLDEVYKEDLQTKVACITYTNAAVNEIRARFPGPDLHVATIHEFLWSLIRRYQKNIRQALTSLVNDGTIQSSLNVPVSEEFWEHPIEYVEWMSLEDGQISHDQILSVAKKMFETHSVLARVLIDTFDYLLIDEFQDTPTLFLETLLEQLAKSSHGNFCVGFFGDSEQAIYEGGKGKEVIDRAISSGVLKEITKVENRRNPATVIRVINKLRSDGLVQEQATDPGAPNRGKIGSARFVYSKVSVLDTGKLKELPYCKDWSFTSEDTKLLYLGKAMIARENRFPNLMEIYDKDRIVAYAKKIRSFLEKKGEAIPDDITFGEVFREFGPEIAPTPVQQTYIEQHGNAFNIALDSKFDDVSRTSLNSDRLLGTKKISDYDDRDRSHNRDPLANHLIAIQHLRRLFREERFNAVIRAVDAAVVSIDERRRIVESLRALDDMESCSIGEVVALAERSKLLRPRDELVMYRERHAYRYSRVVDVPFGEVAGVYDYVENYSPYSTQHGVKGSEWENIFVSLDNGGWRNYDFEKLLANPEASDSVIDRSRMMLYVACSRAKENLVVYVHQPKASTLTRAREWFGDDNVLLVD